MRDMKFRGLSGQAYKFVRVGKDTPWARNAGLALFAAQGPFGWRVVKLTSLRGRLHDVQPIWALADAERYGAQAVFVLEERCSDRRARILADLDAGLSPVCASDREPLALAA